MYLCWTPATETTCRISPSPVPCMSLDGLAVFASNVIVAGTIDSGQSTIGSGSVSFFEPSRGRQRVPLQVHGQWKYAEPCGRPPHGSVIHPKVSMPPTPLNPPTT